MALNQFFHSTARQKCFKVQLRNRPLSERRSCRSDELLRCPDFAKTIKRMRNDFLNSFRALGYTCSLNVKMSMSNRTVLTRLVCSLWHTPQYKAANPNITKKKGVKEEESLVTWFRRNLICQKMEPDKRGTKVSNEEKQECLTPGKVPWSMADKFFYFAYGSNMLEKRILINNPSARKCGFGKLKDFRLDFITQSKRWHGASATIVPSKGSEVWGVIWSLENADMPNLDKQEGVDEKIYFPLTVEVEGWGCDATKCRVYQQCNNPKEFCDLSDLPEERRPSQLYLDTIIKGAVENELPSHYVEFLKTIKDNGYVGHGLPQN